ncbi:TFIIH complex subunit tfb5 [Ascosphaera pollenicola]|nr:TFIIH complex subunit tfb5 [Ascosphaera pollenicola]
MPTAQRGSSLSPYVKTSYYMHIFTRLPSQQTGVLIDCDPSVKAVILKLDAERGNSYVVHDLEGERWLVVKEGRLGEQEIDRKLMQPEEDDSSGGEEGS